jgi:formate dehydrogenase maturation protein FdhE
MSEKRCEHQVDFVNGEADHCPVCGTGFITGKAPDVEGRQVFQEVSCDVCYSVWEVRYVLAGYELRTAEQFKTGGGF